MLHDYNSVEFVRIEKSVQECENRIVLISTIGSDLCATRRLGHRLQRSQIHGWN